MNTVNPSTSHIATPSAQRPTGPAPVRAASTTSESRATPSQVSNQVRPTRVKAADVFVTLRDPARSHHEKASLLLEAIANGVDNINAKDRVKGTGMEQWSLLHHAVNLDSSTALKAILDAPHIALHTGDKSGSTALHLAAKQGKTEAVDYLLDKHQQAHPGNKDSLFQFVNAVNRACRTPMHLAATAPNGPSIMERLYKAGASVDPTTRAGLSTPLSYAVRSFPDNKESTIEAARWLMAHGANAESPLIVNKTNRTVTAAVARANASGNFTTPAKIATENHWTELTSILVRDDIHSAGSQPQGMTGLTDEGRLDVNVPIQSHLEALAINKVNGDLVEDLARLICEDVYDDTEHLYDGSDPYYTCKGLAREGVYVDLDHDDLMSASKEHVYENRSDWLDNAVSAAGDDIRSRLADGIADYAAAISELRESIQDGLRDHCMEVMDRIARDWK